MVQELIDLKRNDGTKGYTEMEWGEVVTIPTESNLVNNMAFKDNAVVLFQSNYHTREGRVIRTRKRPKKTSSRAKTARKPFGNEPTKDLPLPSFDDEYNYGIGAVDVGDQLKSYNPGLRPQRRGGWHAIWHWMLNIVLVNCYLISLHSKVAHKSLQFTKQSTFRKALIDALLYKGSANLKEKGARKRCTHAQTHLV
jgi:ribosomal protein L21